MESNGVNCWLQKQLKPFSKTIEKVPAEAFSYLSLSLSCMAGALLYFAQAQYWPLAVLPAALILFLRLLSDSLQELLAAVPSEQNRQTSLLAVRLCDRLADLCMFLGFAFWDSLRVHLVLMAIVSMLLVSYIAEVARSLGAQECSGGLLCKPNRIILLIFFCFVYLFKPNARIADYSVFEVMFALFIPLASLTLLQRMGGAIEQMRRK